MCRTFVTTPRPPAGLIAPRRAHLICLLISNLCVKLLVALLFTNMSTQNYKHPLNCSSKKFPLVLIMLLGMACSCPNKVNPFKPNYWALHPHRLSLPLGRTSVTLHRSWWQHSRQLLPEWYLWHCKSYWCVVVAGDFLSVYLHTEFSLYEQAAVGVIKASVYSDCHDWSKASALSAGTEQDKGVSVLSTMTV